MTKKLLVPLVLPGNPTAALEAAPKQYVDPGAWQTPTLLNSWIDYGVTFQTARYRRQGDTVIVEGLIKGGAMLVNTVLFTLATGYRPLASHIFMQALTGANAFARVDVQGPGGNVILGVAAASNAYLSLDGISFTTS